ncbi:MAG: Cof-type HAD-IIB family hydrolase [Propionibacteriaceae bacterium]|nr:Cof-type HAD-IIB family hydrolase [Propionibacteriaceae bacterium]
MAIRRVPQQWKPQLVAVDIDGTIVGRDGIVPPEIAEKLCQIRTQGVPVVIVTGRSWLSSQIILDQLQIPGIYCVCNNGATVVTYPPLALHRAETFDPTPILEVVRHHPTAIVAIEDFGRGYKVSKPFPPGIYSLHGETTLVTLDEMAQEPQSRVILRDPESSAEEFDVLLAQIDLGDLYSARVAPTWLDLGASTAGKDKGLAFVAAQLGIEQADVLGIGDGYNDIDLLSWVGRGVALGDSPPELVAVADHVTASFAEGGTLSELRRWFE